MSDQKPLPLSPENSHDNLDKGLQFNLSPSNHLPSVKINRGSLWVFIKCQEWYIWESMFSVTLRIYSTIQWSDLQLYLDSHLMSLKGHSLDGHLSLFTMTLEVVRELSFFTGRGGRLSVMADRHFFLVSPFAYGKNFGPPLWLPKKILVPPTNRRPPPPGNKW